MIFLLGILVTLTGLAQTFNNINEYQLLANAVVQDTSPLIFRKGVYDDYSEKINTSLLGSVTEEDIKAFEDGGYDGEMFKLYRYPIPIAYNYDNITMGKPSSYNVLKGFYLQQNGNGVLQCSEEYLVSKYGVDGKLKVLSGSLNAEPYGIVVTDFSSLLPPK